MDGEIEDMIEALAAQAQTEALEAEVDSKGE